MSLDGLSELVFNFTTDIKAYERAFCLDPPSDICPFGKSCPNGDVTGIGQQVSIYVVTLVFAIVLAYIPTLRRELLYAHLSIIFSLIIAAVISIYKSELTNGDARFVLLSISSPTTLYIWLSTLLSLVDPKAYFIRADYLKENPKECRILKAVTLASLVLFIVLAIVVHVPFESIEFPQQACGGTGYTLIPRLYRAGQDWSWLIQICFFFIVAGIAYGLTGLWVIQGVYDPPPASASVLLDITSSDPEDTPPPLIDLITWTEQLLLEQFGPSIMNQSTRTAIVAVLQFSALLRTKIFGLDSLICWIILAFGMFRYPPPPEENNPATIYAIRTLVLVVCAGLTSMNFTVLTPISLPDWAMLFIAMTSARWSYTKFSTKNMKVFLPILLVLLSGIAAFVHIFPLLPWSMEGVIKTGEPLVKFDEEIMEAVRIQLTMALVPLSLWFVSWESTTSWPWVSNAPLSGLKNLVLCRAHLLKFLFGLSVHVCWIQTCNRCNPSGEIDFTFGQIFAFLASAVSVFSIGEHLMSARSQIKGILLTVLTSRRFSEYANVSDQDLDLDLEDKKTPFQIQVTPATNRDAEIPAWDGTWVSLRGVNRRPVSTS